jgi:general stress protein CsbA
MTHREKVALLVADLKAKGVNRYTTAPPLFRLVWSFGFELSPPFYISFFPIMLFAASWFGTWMGVCTWLIFMRRRRSLTLTGFLLPIGVASLLFGFYVALYYRWKAKQLNLPEWRDYGESP